MSSLGIAQLTSGPLVWLLFAQLLVAPVVEETLFRRGLQDGLLRRQWAGSMSVLISALLFGAAHAVTLGWGAAVWRVLPGMLLGWIYLRGRRLWPCIAMHSAMNLMALVWLTPGPTAAVDLVRTLFSEVTLA